MEGISVIFPARNEQASLAVIIPFLSAASNSASEVIVILDSLEDQTWSLSKLEFTGACPVRFILNESQGVLGAIQTGVKNSNCDYSIVCAADEYLPLLSIDNFYSHLRSGSDFVSGTRYRKGGKRYGGSYSGRKISWIANALIRTFLRNELSDFTTGIKAFKNLHFERLSIGANYVGWSCSLTFALNAKRMRLSISEVPIISVDRVLGGSSTFQLRKWFFGYLNAIKRFVGLKGEAFVRET